MAQGMYGIYLLYQSMRLQSLVRGCIDSRSIDTTPPIASNCLLLPLLQPSFPPYSNTPLVVYSFTGLYRVAEGLANSLILGNTLPEAHLWYIVQYYDFAVNAVRVCGQYNIIFTILSSNIIIMGYNNMLLLGIVDLLRMDLIIVHQQGLTQFVVYAFGRFKPLVWHL